MGVVPIFCVKKVSETSRFLSKLFEWRSTHGGDEFDELISAEGERMLWLHDLDAHEHARFKENSKGNLGRGFAGLCFRRGYRWNIRSC